MNRYLLMGILFGLVGLFFFNLGSAANEAMQRKEQKKFVFTREPDFIKLKSIDDRAFLIAGESLQTCSKIIVGVSEGNLRSAEQEGKKFDLYLDQVSGILEERSNVLKRLGY